MAGSVSPGRTPAGQLVASFAGFRNGSQTDEDLLAQLRRPISRMRPSRGSAPVPMTNSSLSSAAIRRMCSSKVYRDEWRCFGYPLPGACV